MKSILVIGGNGFIGSHLVESLSKNYSVTVFDKSKNLFLDEDEDVEYIYGDFTDVNLLSEVLIDKQVVYHLLSTTVPYTADLNPIFDVETNLIATLKLLEQIVDKNVERFIYTSSGGTVYGNPKYLPIDEKHPCYPLGSYGTIKHTIEQYVRIYAQKYGFSYLIARPSNPYGPRQNYVKNQGLIAKLIYNGICQDTFTIWGDGSAVRDYLYIDDLVDFLKIAGLSSESGIFNVGSGIGMSINQIIESLSSIIENMPLVEYTDNNTNFVDKVFLDINHAKEKFDWTPKITLKEGLRLTNEWMKLNSKEIK